MKRLLLLVLITFSLQSSAQDAQVTFKDRLIQFISETYQISNAPLIVDYVFEVSKEKNLDPAWILAMIKVESRYDEKAKSYANAHGLMQVHYPSHRSKVSKKSDLYDIQTNIDLGTDIWKDCRQEAKHLSQAARCYSGGHQQWLASVQKEYQILHKLYKDTI